MYSNPFFRFGILLLFALTGGCHTMSGNTAYQAEPGPENGFLARTARFFRPLMPESATEPAAPKYGNDASGMYDPSAACPIPFGQPRRPSQRLFSMTYDENLFDSPEIATASHSEETTENASGKARRRKSAGISENSLEAREGDSEKFRWLLERIEETPPEERGVDRAELEQLISTYRSSSLVWDQDPDLETKALLTLRNKILPDFSKSMKKSALRDREIDEDESEFAETRKPKRRTKNDAGKTKRSLEEDEDDSLYADKETEAPLPPMKPAALRKKSTAPAPETAAPDGAIESSLYPKLAQLDEASIVPASYQSPNAPGALPAAGDWFSQTRIAADMLRHTIKTNPEARTLSNEGRLRLLELVLGNRSEAVRPFGSAEKAVNGFWGNQMLGFSAFLDDAGQPNRQERFVNAAYHIDEGLMDLRRLCPMKLRNAQIVQDWAGFGVFLPRTEDCRAGEEIAVYMELENPTIRRLTQGYNVKTAISYEIRDTASNVVLKKDCKNPVEETTPSRKRDYCIRLFIELPKTLAHGQYQLRLSVTDMNNESQHFAEEQIPFKVVP